MAHPGSPAIATIERAVRLGFTMGIEQELATPWMPFFESEPMSTKRKLLRDLLGVGLMKKEIDNNGPKFFEDLEANFQIEACAYSLGHQMRLDDISDDLDGILSPSRTGRMLGIEAMNSKARDAYRLMALGDTTTLGTCYDGGAFFNETHPMTGASAPYNDPNYEGPDEQSNLTIGAEGGEDPWLLLSVRPGMYRPFIYGSREEPRITSQTNTDSDVVFEEESIRFKVRGRWTLAYGNWFAAHLVKDTSLTADNYVDARTKMQQLVSYRGQKLDVSPTHIIVTANNIKKARDIFSASLVGGGDTNVLAGDVQIVGTELLNVA